MVWWNFNYYSGTSGADEDAEKIDENETSLLFIGGTFSAFLFFLFN